MKWTLLIYIFVLFVLFTPNVLFRIPIKNNLLVACVHSVIFSFILLLTYNFINPNIENLENQESTGILEKILKNIFNKARSKKKKYSIHNVIYELTPSNYEFTDITYNGKTIKNINY